MKIKGFVLSLLLSISLSAFSQSSVATQSTPSREDVLKLIDKLRLKSTMELMLKQVVAQAKASARQAFLARLPEATAEQQAIMGKLTDDTFAEINVDELLQDVIPVYQRHLSKEDVSEIIAFYSSRSGQKMLDETPAMMAEMSQASGTRMQQKMSAISRKIDERMAELLKTVQAPGKNATTKSQPK
ncbi:MAG: hypothetical protein JWN45_3197 [Acidobacteriaceae bacterium]|nr:hypothetical protein [Acidobacteriaceae bacterium]